MTASPSDDPTSKRERELIEDALGEAFDGGAAAPEEAPTGPLSPRPVGGPGVRPDHRPERVGPYRIIREIGRGGMGVVYLGVRERDPLERRVAVKVLKRGIDTEEILKRFEHERQALAALNHPGIARLYDAGETEDGLPYFAMDYIEGQPIDDYCDTHRLRIAERLELFRRVCAAVHHVHQNLMVHRDLKPSNILVTADGQPKLLDFGIAKLINPEMSLLHGDPTAPERRIMTLEYASPEQVRGNPISIASDIYSLGVILYELLTGHRPYQLKSRIRAEKERVICEVDPARPSTAASEVEVIEPDDPGSGTSTTITPELVAKVREGRPDRLRRRLAGDIDNIVLMAMRKPPQRRYQSAQQFGEDIRRHLDGLPVVARADTAGYRFTKFVRRHRWGVAAAAAVLVALIGWGATAARHGTVVEAERDRTRRVLDEFLELVLMRDLYTTIKPLDGSLPALQLLAETAQDSLEDVRPYVGEDPRLLRGLAAAHDHVGVIWGGHRGPSLGKTDIALDNHRTALAIRRKLLAQNPDDPELQSDMALSHLRIGDVLRFTGNVTGALESYGRYLDMVEALPRENPMSRRRFAIALGSMGSILKDLGRLEEARDHYERSLSVRKDVLVEHPNDAQAVTDAGVGYVHVGEALALLGDAEGALKMYRESIVLRQRLVRRNPDNGRNQRYLALSHYYAAGTLLKLDRPREAAFHVEAAVPIFQQRSEDNPNDARSKQDLALALDIRGRLDAALGYEDRALESYGRYQAVVLALSELSPKNTLYGEMLADSHELMGDLRREMGHGPAAVRAYRQALGIIRPLAAADSSDIDLQLRYAGVLSALGAGLIESGEPLEARSRLEEARSIQSSILDSRPSHARARAGLVLTLRRMSRAAGKRGYPHEALAFAQEAIEIPGEPDPEALRDLAAALALDGDHERAIAAVEQALDLLPDRGGPRAEALRQALQEDLTRYREAMRDR